MGQFVEVMFRSRLHKKGQQGLCIVLLFCFTIISSHSCGGRSRPPVITIQDVAPPPPITKSRRGERIPRIRVLLKKGFQSVSIEGSELAPVVVVKVREGIIFLSDKTGKELGSSTGFRLKALGGKPMTLDGMPYRDIIEVFINPLLEAIAVNELSLEGYLKGVVPNELDSTNRAHAEAIKALSIAARTFAYSSLGQNAVQGFDVYPDNRSQVYRGFNSEKILSSQIIEETRGMVVTYQDQPIVAFYSSTCGGRTENYQEVFQRNAIPYLQGGVVCPDTSGIYHTWDKHILISKIQGSLDELVGVGKLSELDPIRKSHWGRTVEMKFVGTKGEKILRSLDIRSALGLPSIWITNFDVSRDHFGYITEIHAEGKGWGHGVGLCQIGTVELARQGWNFERIIKHYYTGTEITYLW